MHAHYDHYGMQLGLQLFNLHKYYKFTFRFIVAPTRNIVGLIGNWPHRDFINVLPFSSPLFSWVLVIIAIAI
jgi:hypothetical protein